VKWTKIIEQFVTNLNNICLNEITEKISDLKHNLTESNSSAEIPAKLDNLVHDFSDLLKNAVNKGNNKITELRTILQRESQNS
jgi:hypothetical protein